MMRGNCKLRKKLSKCTHDLRMDFVKDGILSIISCISCFPEPTVELNGERLRIVRLLGEGGFSFVYLVTNLTSGGTFALKKIRCLFGDESLERAMNEVDAYKLFNHPSIINAIDFSVIQEKDESKTVYILLPFFRRGNLQDAINANLVNQQCFPEEDLLRLFRNLTEAIEAIHYHREPPASTDRNHSRRRHPINGQDIDFSITSNVLAYAHRDIKPGNIMIADDGVTPVLMDFGSLTHARQLVQDHADGIRVQEEAAVHSTISYRAPELFDCPTATQISEKVDIWSLGATLFACLYGSSPFEGAVDRGGSIALAVANAQYQIPEKPNYSETTKDIIRQCLTVEAENRPSAKRLLKLFAAAIERLRHCGGDAIA